MENAGWAGLGIIPTFDGFQSKLEQGSAKHLAAAGVTGGEKFGDEAGKSAGRKFSSRIKTAAKVGAGILAVATAGAVRFTNDALAEAREAQKIGALTTSTIKATGKAAKVTAKHVGDLSGAISEQAGIDDEVIQRGANMILTFKNIRNEQGKNNKIFDEATKVTADMAAAMAGGSGEVDLKSSAILVGKALNDPAKGLSALTRVGVTFTSQQQDQIKTLVASGDSMKAQKVILRELQSQFGGAAAAQATAGEKLSVTWGNFKEDIGTQMLPVLDDLQNWMRKKGIPMLRDFSDWFSEDGGPAIKGFVDDAKPFVKDVLTKTRDILREATPLAKKFVGFFKEIPSGVWQTAAAVGLLGTVGSKLPGAKAGLKLGTKGVGGLLGVATKAKPLPVWVVNEGFGGKGGPGGVPVGGLPSGKPTGAPKVPGLPNTWLTTKAPFWTKLLKGAPMLGASTGMRTIETTPITDPKDVKNLELQKFLVEQTTNAVVTQNNAWLKVRHDIDRGKGSIEAAVDEAFRLDGAIKKVEGRKQTKIEAPNLLNLLDQVQRYGSWLDGLDGRVVKTFITTRLDHNAGQLERFGHVEGVGATGGIVRRPTVALLGEAGPEAVVPLNRTRGNGPLPGAGVQVNIGTVQAQDYRDFMAQMQRRAQLAALNGGWE